MSSTHFCRAIGFAVLAALSISAQPRSATAENPPEANPIGGKIKWVYDYQQGKQLSKETGKPMFVVFRCER